ncbi:hypothetical protein B296_00004601 [Ensete ventricosum]|uniref:Uncharacterized protein n=1 Tax=Ensete ventricosum TaxID=4639 RepID=A0A427AJZ7_ENSVE|nr:hypothetical protein B296_00004601 [Ensete ventricosum]
MLIDRDNSGPLPKMDGMTQDKSTWKDGAGGLCSPPFDIHEQHVPNEQINRRFGSIGCHTVSIRSHKNPRRPYDSRAKATSNRQHEQPPVVLATLNRLADNARSMMRSKHDQLTIYKYKRGIPGVA